MRLLRVLGVWFGIAVTVGNTIGGGILRVPGDIAGFLPQPWMFVGIWFLGALYALLGANALSELGTMMPRSGGQFVFVRHAFGDYAGFVVGWMDWLSTCASIAAISIVIGESVAYVLGWAAGAAAPIAMTIVIIFTLLLINGTSLGDRVQRATSLLKALALLVLIGACFLGTASHPVAAAAVAAPITKFAAFLLAAQAVIYAYDGWSAPIYFSEELRDPAREIPRASFYGLLSVAVIYILINVAFARALPLASFAGSPLAGATIASALFGARGELLVRMVVIVAVPSGVNACLLMASRVLYSMSRDGLGFRGATKVNTGGTPTTALIIGGMVALGFLASGTFNDIIAIAAFFFVASYLLSFTALFLLRHREPDASRPYRAVGHPYTTAVVWLGSLGFLISAVASDRRNSLIALGILVISYPAFRMMRSASPSVPVASADPYLSE